MKCRVGFKALSLYVDGRYTTAKREEIEAHIEGCVECKHELEGLKMLKSSLQNLPHIKESEGFDLAFHRLLQERLNRHKVRIGSAGPAAALARIRDAFAYPVQVVVKVAASFILVIAILAGMHAHTMQRSPFVEFVAGGVRIYRPSAKDWVAPKTNMRLMPGDKILGEEGAILNIASKGMYKARLKDDSLIVISKLHNGLRRTNTGFSISYGEFLVNTTERFKGSSMDIHTPACDAEVVGTAFIVNVIPDDKMTWLGVLNGKVKVTSKVHPLKDKEEKGMAVYVSSGQKTQVKPYAHPSLPELLSEVEWRKMQELYQLSDVQRIILLIGTDVDRIEELLRPAPVYIPQVWSNVVPRQIRNKIDFITEATSQNNYPILEKSVRELEELLRRYPNPEYDVEILMFVGSHYHYIKAYDDAMRVFREVIKNYPDSQYASLAQCAIATIYQQDLGDLKMAEKTYRLLIQAYPNSIDAARAEEMLSTIR